MLRLYVLGPAFGCASIDPQCNAAVALVRAWEKRTGGQWQLVCAAEEFDRLPLLETEGKRIYGFRDIARYLNDGGEKRKAEHISIEAFVESHGQTLLDIAYYVSYENYRARTRPAFTKVLPWYANYIIPPRRRAAARDRTRHLGISGIDMDDVHESVLDDKPPENLSMAERRYRDEDKTERRARTLLGRKRTVQSMLRRPEHSGAFKLKNLADNFYEPLAAMLEDEKGLEEDGRPTTAACLVYGYLTLLGNRTLPQSWAADIMVTHYKSLATFVDDMASRLDMRVDAAIAESLFSGGNKQRTAAGGLPWTSAPAVAFGDKLSFCGHALLRQLPFLPEPMPVKQSPNQVARRSVVKDHLPQVMFSSAVSVALTGWIVYRLGFWPQGQAEHIFGRRRLSDFGAAGAALSVLGNLQ
ncbi:hypothetical protein K461DRAFT_246961 [Myriangium duriaei CBS 260.36]|uniref:Mitochondrial outer membrane transport complex Sam37/metaxin N-terminal domain-containing protein n=1 Tax=Myriangium duriaei CBS 260.36 TaxID=1168546 RepID=A0A9P4MD47_9PEZI|nr:hypothetical protein K461DRAFT_246961 [Myriangium duriaei CBS 260.36]